MKSLRLFWPIGLLALLLTGPLAGAQPTAAARFNWLRTAYNTEPTINSSATLARNVTDAAGNTYVSLFYWGDLNLGGQHYPAAVAGEQNALVKLDTAGAVQWVKPLGSATDSTMWHLGPLAVDAAGNVQAILFMYTAQRPGLLLDGLAVTPPPPNGFGVYAATWRPDGTILRATLVADDGASGGGPLVIGAGMAPNGDVLLAGVFYGAGHVGGVATVPSAPNLVNGTGYVARVRPNGTAVWVHQFTNADSATRSTMISLQLDAAGNAYALGRYLGDASFGGQALPTAPALADGQSLMWTKINPAGQITRVQPLRPNQVPSYSVAALCVRPADGFSFVLTYLGQPQTIAPGLTLTPGGRRDLLLLALDANGALQWAKQVGGTTPDAVLDPKNLALGANDRLYVSADRQGIIRTDQVQLGLAAPTERHACALALSQKDGSALWGVETTGPQSLAESALQISAAPGGATWTVAGLPPTAQFGNLTATTTNGAGQTALVRIIESYNALTGAAYLDANADGQQNATETGFPGGLVVEVNPGAIPCVAPEATGRYDAYVGLLNTGYTAALASPPAHYTVVPQGPAVATPFAAYGQVGAARSFALQPIPGQQDMQVLLTLISPARPGNLLNYHVQYRNTGTVPLAAGTVVLAPDARLTFYAATVVPSNLSGNVLTWNYAALAPGETRHFSVVFRLPAATPLGGVLTSTATVAPLVGDLLPLDNTSTAVRVITGSYDPNDIEVNHLRLSTQQVAAGEWLEYTIRFQNHGTDTAFTVVLTDSLPIARLRPGSVQLLAASHNCNWGLSPAGVLTVQYPDIRLPAQLTNQLASDGFVRFRVQPLTTLNPGDDIPNQARIHFDYNVPLATNTALTTVDSPLGLATESPAAGSLRVWPNPATGTLHVEAGTSGPLTLLDALGRPVRHQALAARQTALVDLTGLAPGLYVLRTGAATRRVVVR